MSESRTIFVATKNAGKMTELRQLFAGSGWKLDTYDGYEDVVEGESSYRENAALKANALARQLHAAGIVAATLGDDSGIEVVALGRRPGVLSARYGGPAATWADRRNGLRTELAAAGASDRRARFVCALHFISAAGESVELERDVWGEISHADAGAHGFSYDPAFIYPPAAKTFAELGDEEKNRVSHRGLAVAALLREIAMMVPGRGEFAP